MSALSKHEAIYDRDYVESLEDQVAMQHQLIEKLESALTLIESVSDSLREE